MSNVSIIDPFLRDELVRCGWQSVGRGTVGEMWTSADGVRMPVPFDLAKGRRELQAILVMLARERGVLLRDAESSAMGYYSDEMTFRFAGDGVKGHELTFQQFESASAGISRLMRIAVNTARKRSERLLTEAQRDEVLEGMFVGLTKPGSYIIPVRLDFGAELSETMRSLDDGALIPKHDPLETRQAFLPSARFVTERFATLLDNVMTFVINPEKEPDSEAIEELEDRGVRKQAVNQLVHMVSRSDVDIRIHFAESISDRKGETNEVELLHEALPRLQSTANRLTDQPDFIPRDVVGVITEIGYTENEHGTEGQRAHLKLEGPDRRVKNIYLEVFGEDGERIKQWYDSRSLVRVVGETTKNKNGDTVMVSVEFIERAGDASDRAVASRIPGLAIERPELPS